MNITEQRQAARKFVKRWQGIGSEKADAHKFWIELLENVFGMEKPTEHIDFEFEVPLDGKHKGYIDIFIPEKRVIIEQKTMGKDLEKAARQSDGRELTPFEQAKRYAFALPRPKIPRWIVVCNFQTFQVHDLDNPRREPAIIALKDLPKELYRLSFLVSEKGVDIGKEQKLSVQAGEIVGKLYDALLACYVNPKSEASLKSLNVLCVRLVFCLYAEKADVFGSHTMFRDYLQEFKAEHLRRALIDLFAVLDTKEEERDPYLTEDLAAFPYVNGGLFRDAHIEIPNFTAELKNLLLEEADKFSWNEISPTIFGAVFESTLNPETRRQGGMHYTSIENIHKVIDPLFLDELKAEYRELGRYHYEKNRRRKALELQKKLASLQFLDPAAGSGNFLTETYLSLRHLENKIIADSMRESRSSKKEGGNTTLNLKNIVKVSIEQFHGIEINDFAVSVAKCALWIAENQMLQKTQEIVHVELDFLPLKTHANIVEGNALTIDWEMVVPKEKLNYIMGNPPFSGYSMQTKEQKANLLAVLVDEKDKPYKKAGKLDYVAGWYYKTAKYLQGTEMRAALVSTNSITQGEQVAGLWKPLFEQFGIHIDFAYKTFLWNSESNTKAFVYCVIVGFSSAPNHAVRRIYEEKFMEGEKILSSIEVKNVNAYLIDALDVFVESRTNPLCDVPNMIYGNKPTDGGHLFLTEDEYTTALKSEPNIKPYLRQIYGALEFINNVKRYCLWLVNASPSNIKASHFIKNRVQQVKQFRLQSTKQATRESAQTPTLFQEIRQPNTQYIAIPEASSNCRYYIPIGFLSGDVIASNALRIIPDAKLYHFGILTSNVHMIWMRAVASRWGVTYRYSKDIVYNNFPWPKATPKQKAAIEKTAQAILDARAQFPDASLADLYDPNTMPSALTKAHQANDHAVMRAYGFSTKISEPECLAKLFALYEKLVKKL